MENAAADRPGGFSFQGRRALIFGGAKGIGQAVAMEFAARGAAVCVADIDLGAAEDTAARICGAGGEATALSCDVTDEADVRETAMQGERLLGEIDIVMNNVGSLVSGNPEDIPSSEWRRILDLNFFSMVFSNGFFLPRMIARRGGYIVNTASFAGLYPYAANRIPYAASKAAVIAMTEALALHLLPQGVRISCFCPGPVATGVMEGVRNWTPDAAFRGPGRQYRVLTSAQAAAALADGMRDGRIVIPSDPAVWDDIRAHAADADGFIAKRIAAFEAGDAGMPAMPTA